MYISAYIVVLCLLSSAPLSATVPLKSDTLSAAAKPIQRPRSTFPFTPGVHPDDYHGITATHSNLVIRAMEAVPIGNNWFLVFEQCLYAIPYQEAANQLIVFYDALQAEAADRANQMTPAALTSFGKGNLRLDIASDAVIPWFFVGAFASWMAQITHQGFAGLYRARVVSGAGVTVIMTLQIVAPPGMGPIW